MYKIGVFTDVHGNDLALKTVLDFLNKQSLNEIISLGDLIAIGPNSNEVLNIVTTLPNFTSIRGNHEKYYLYGFANPDSCTEATHQEWVKRSIDKKHEEFLQNTIYQLDKVIEGVKLTFIHYPLRSIDPVHYEYIEHNTTAENLNILFRNFSTEVICYGHEHVSSFVNGNALYLNPGSCGCPYPEKDITRCMILTIDKGKVSYEHFKIKYDSTKVVNDMYEKEMPERDFISSNFYLYKNKA